jgi:cytochrome c oxidase assembly protein subunit 15
LRSEEGDLAIFGWGEIFSSRGALLLITFFFTYFQLYLGGRVSSNNAGLACPDWPTCGGAWLPPMVGHIRFQMEHRFMAYLILLLVIINFFVAILGRYDRRSKFFSKMALHICVFQIILGVMNVLLQLPILLTALHTGTGVALLSTLYIALFYRIASRSDEAKAKSFSAVETELA